MAAFIDDLLFVAAEVFVATFHCRPSKNCVTHRSSPVKTAAGFMLAGM